MVSSLMAINAQKSAPTIEMWCAVHWVIAYQTFKRHDEYCSFLFIWQFIFVAVASLLARDNLAHSLLARLPVRNMTYICMITDKRSFKIIYSIAKFKVEMDHYLLSTKIAQLRKCSVFLCFMAVWRDTMETGSGRCSIGYWMHFIPPATVPVAKRSRH